MTLVSTEFKSNLKDRHYRITQLVSTRPRILTAGEAELFEELCSSLEADIKTLDSVRNLEEKLERFNVKGKGHPLQELSPENIHRAERLALSLFLKTGQVPLELMPLMKLASQSTTPTAGGYTIPQGFANELERAVKYFGGMWQAARIWKTEKGNYTPWATVNDTDNKAYQIEEAGDLTTDAEAVTFGASEFRGYKYTSGLIQVPNELLEDSEYFFEELIKILSERLYRGTNEDFTIADGVDKPKGILESAVYGVSSVDDTTIDYDDFVNLKHSVDPGYRSQAVWMFHDTVLQAVEKIKDDQNRPIFTNLDSGIILGNRFIINNDMPVFTAGSASANDNKKLVLYGDFKRYIIRMAKGIRIVKLHERFAEKDQTAFVVLFRVDGNQLNAGTNPIKFLRTSAT